MKEVDYIKVTNKTKIQVAQSILRDVFPSEDSEYGISKEELRNVMKTLDKAYRDLYHSMKAGE